MMRRIFSFRGRLRRSQFLLTLVCASIVPGILLALAARLDRPFLMILLFVVTYVPCLWASIAAGVKRLHDFGRHGITWLYLFIPLFNIYWAFLMLLKDSDVGPNRYGDDPKGRFAGEMNAAE